MFCPLTVEIAYVSIPHFALSSDKSHHFARQERQAYMAVNIGRNPTRQHQETHLNFFRGFEYEPTFDCEAMMADTGMKEIIERRMKEWQRREEHGTEDDAFSRSKQRHYGVLMGFSL